MRPTHYLITALTLSLGVAVMLLGRETTKQVPHARSTVVKTPPPAVAHAASPRPFASRPDLAPPPIVLAPRLPTESMLALRDEVDLGVRRCTSEAAGRHPGVTARISIKFRLAARAGRVRVIDTTLEDFDDVALASCIADAARPIELAAADDQEDGLQSVTVFFDL